MGLVLLATVPFAALWLMNGSELPVPFTIGLQFSATQPHNPSPTLIFKEERARKFSPLTSSGSNQPLRFTKTAIESKGIILRRRIDNTESVSLRLRETPRSWLSSNMV